MLDDRHCADILDKVNYIRWTHESIGNRWETKQVAQELVSSKNIEAVRELLDFLGAVEDLVKG